MPLFFTLATSSSLVVWTGALVTWMPSAISSALSMTCGGYLEGRQEGRREGPRQTVVPRRPPRPLARPAELTGIPGRRGWPTPWRGTPGAAAGRCPPPAAPQRCAAGTPGGTASGVQARKPRAASPPRPPLPPSAPGARPPPSPPSPPPPRKHRPAASARRAVSSRPPAPRRAGTGAGPRPRPGRCAGAACARPVHLGVPGKRGGYQPGIVTGDSVNKVLLYRLVPPGLLRSELVGDRLVFYLRIT